MRKQLKAVSELDQGVIDSIGMETRRYFFSYVCNSKKIKELFASILNSIAVSVRWVSSTQVVLNAKLAD